MTELPPYDDLPVSPDRPAGSSWGIWGDDDRLGCLNLLSPERVVAAARLVRKGRTFPMNLPLDQPNPPVFPGRGPTLHHVRGLGRGDAFDDVLTDFNTQASSQWDGFRHIRNLELGFYNGVEAEDHGLHRWAEQGLAGRAVLADVAAWRKDKGRPLSPDRPDTISPADLDGSLAAQESPLGEGAVLLVRTGWLEWYRGLDATARAEIPGNLAAPGLEASEDMARWLWDHRVAAVAADNPALEAWPPPIGRGDVPAPGTAPEASLRNPNYTASAFLHLNLLPLLGLPIGELWDLDGLAADCADDGVYEGFFTSAPLNVRGGVASPPNALVVK